MSISSWISSLVPKSMLQVFSDTSAKEQKVQKFMEDDLSKTISEGLALLKNTDSKLTGDDLLGFRLKAKKIDALTFNDFCIYLHPTDIPCLNVKTTIQLREVYLASLGNCKRSVTNLPFLTELSIEKKVAMKAIEGHELKHSINEFIHRNGVDGNDLLSDEGKQVYAEKLRLYAYNTIFVEIEIQLGIFPLITQFRKCNMKFDPASTLYANIREYLKTQFEKTLEKITTGHGRGFPTDYFYNVSLIETGIFTADWECGKKIIVQFKKSKPIEHPFYLSLKANELLSAETINWVEQPFPTL